MSDALLRVVVIDGLSECDVSWYKSDDRGVGGGEITCWNKNVN